MTLGFIMKKNIITFAFLLISLALFAGDVAAFEDIGFSSDGKTYVLKIWMTECVVQMFYNNYY